MASPAPAAAKPATTTAQPSSATLTARSRAVVRPAIRAPNPPGRAAGDPVATTTATLPVTVASTRDPAASGIRGIEASAVTWMRSTRTSAAMPNGPTSERRMMASASAAGRRLPSPSAVSARPSRCRPPVSSASSVTARAAPSSRRGAEKPPASTHAIAPAPVAPSSSPTAGSQRTARTASPSASAPPVPAGITVNRLSATRSDFTFLTEAAARCPPCTARLARIRRRPARSVFRVRRGSARRKRFQGPLLSPPRC